MAKFTFKKNIKAVLYFAILNIIGCYCFSKFGVYIITVENERAMMLREVENSPKLPQKFIKTYAIIYPDADKGYFYLLLMDAFFGKSSECHCAKASADFAIRKAKGSRINIGLITFYLENSLTQDQCLGFYMSNLRFPENIKGIENAAEFYYHKNIEYLSEDETVELIAMSANPFYFNRYSKRLELRVNSLKEIITNSR
jgi:hypothetical protein